MQSYCRSTLEKTKMSRRQPCDVCFKDHINMNKIKTVVSVSATLKWWMHTLNTYLPNSFVYLEKVRADKPKSFSFFSALLRRQWGNVPFPYHASMFLISSRVKDFMMRETSESSTGVEQTFCLTWQLPTNSPTFSEGLLSRRIYSYTAEILFHPYDWLILVD